MAKSQVIGFRAHPDEDRDIIQALAVYADRTYGIKELLRLGMAVKASYTVAIGQPKGPIAPLDFTPRHDAPTTLTWGPFPEDRPKKEAPKNLEDTLAGNFEDA